MDASISGPANEPLTFRELANLVPNPALCVSLAGVVHDANTAASRAFQRPIGELVGVCMDGLCPAPGELKRYLQRCAGSRQWVPGVISIVARPGQPPVPYRADGALLREGTGTADTLILLRLRPRTSAVDRFTTLRAKLEELSREMSRRLEAERQRELVLAREKQARLAAEQANRLKDEFLATVSHELRTPLNAILGWAHLLQAGHLRGAAAERALETITRNAKTQARLIEDLLDVSRIISGKLRMQVQRVDLADVVEKCVDAAKPAAEKKRIVLAAEVDRSGLETLGDPDRLVQVGSNLLANAIKFTPSEGRVLVRLDRAGSQARITVADTGQGFSSDMQPHLFEAFRQADASPTRRHGGLGLGLAIVKELVQAHGGVVDAMSPGVGAGATFTVRLPLHAGATPLADDADVHEGGAELAGLRVLVVDDDPDARELVAFILQQRHAEVIDTASAAEALAAIEHHPFDVLLADIGMPEQDGLALIRVVRQAETAQQRRLPAIALTAFASMRDREEAVFAGYDVHLSKPIDPQMLVATIARVTRRGGGAPQVYARG